MEIKEVLLYQPETESAVNHFLAQLVSSPLRMSRQQLEELIHSPNSHLFFLYADNHPIGMLTLGIYPAPAGKKAWVEDVVVDSEHRGKGLGAKLIRHAIQTAREKGVSTLMLTSNPARIAANVLYQKEGFQQKHSNLYQMRL